MRRLLPCVVLVTLAGCGHRADPVPPLRKTPPGPTGFRLAERGDALEVSAQAPAASVDGVAYASVVLEFMSVLGEADLEKAGTRRAVTVSPGREVVERLALPPPGTLVRAAVRARFGREAGPKSLTLALVAQAPIEAPRDLVATLGETGIGLSWSGNVPAAVPPPVLGPRFSSPDQAKSSRGVPPPPAQAGPPRGEAAAAPASGRDAGHETPPAEKASSQAVGSEATVAETSADTSTGTSRSGFFVYRRTGQAAYGRPLVEEPLHEPSFDDQAATLGTTACYVVRAVASPDPLIESAPSNEACVEVRDITAPAAPVGLVILPRQAGLELLWSPSAEADLAGYRVYRVEPGGEPERVAEVEVTHSSWVDTSARRGVTYRYAVSAFDQAGNESPPSRAVEATLP
jgi:hypothetical protein